MTRMVAHTIRLRHGGVQARVAIRDSVECLPRRFLVGGLILAAAGLGGHQTWAIGRRLMVPRKKWNSCAGEA